MGIRLAVQGTDAWRVSAACFPDKESHLWFSELHEDRDRALQVCADCSVKGECLDYFLGIVFKEGGLGVWGGQWFAGEKARCHQCKKEFPRELFPPVGRLCESCAQRTCERCGSDNMPAYLGVGRRHDLCEGCRVRKKRQKTGIDRKAA